MRYVINKNGEKISPKLTGERARCSICNCVVVAKCGEFKINHWSHLTLTDCDSWKEPITDWHLSWQNIFPKENIEVVIKGDNNEKHRADIKLNNGLVIEVQNSPISSSDIRKRERFYGVDNMIWILNGKNLLRSSNIVFRLRKKEFSMMFSIPHYLHCIEESSEGIYDYEEFKNSILKSKVFTKLRNDKSLIDFYVKNECDFYFEFSTNKDFHKIKKHLFEFFANSFQELDIEFDVYSSIKDKSITTKYNFYFDFYNKNFSS